MNNLKEIGKISSTYGLNGSFKIDSYLASVNQFKELDRIYIFGYTEPFKIKGIRTKKNSCFITLYDIDSIDKIEKLVGLSIYIEADFEFKKEENEYYHGDLIGLDVYVGDKLIGKVDDVISGNVQDVLMVSNGEDNAMVPFVVEFIEDIDLGKKNMYLKIVEGLIPWL